MTKCTMCNVRLAEYVVYPSWEAAEARTPRQNVCGPCSADIINSRRGYRLGAFSLVMMKEGSSPSSPLS